MPAILAMILETLGGFGGMYALQRLLSAGGAQAAKALPKLAARQLPSVMGKIGMPTVGRLGTGAANLASFVGGFPAGQALTARILGDGAKDAEGAAYAGTLTPGSGMNDSAMQRIAMQAALDNYVQGQQDDEQLIQDLLRGLSNGKTPMRRLI